MIKNLHLPILIFIFVCCLITACDRPPTEIGNPRTRWKTSPDGGTLVKPRNQIYRPGSETSVFPDELPEPDGNPTGLVFFGPTGGTDGSPNSQAVTEFKCGNSGANCEVEVTVTGLSMTTRSHAQYEYLVITLQNLDAAGNPIVGQSDQKEQQGSAATTTHKLRVPGCGMVRVTLSFRETINQYNPAGIQTPFNAQIKKYGCTN